MTKTVKFPEELGVKSKEFTQGSSISGLPEITESEEQISDQQSGKEYRKFYKDHPLQQKFIEQEEQKPHESVGKTFSFDSDFKSLLESSPMASSLAPKKLSQCIIGAQKIAKSPTPDPISFNCQDLNEMYSFEKDSKLFVLRIQNNGLSPSEMERVLLPVFLVMANVITMIDTGFHGDLEETIRQYRSSKPQEKEDMLDEVLALSSGEGDFAKKILFDAKELQQKMEDVKSLICGPSERKSVSAKLSQVIELMAGEISDYISKASNGMVLAELVNTENLGKYGDKEIMVEKKPNPHNLKPVTALVQENSGQSLGKF